MVYDLIQISNDVFANYMPLLRSRTADLLLDYQRGYEVDRDELILLLIEDFYGNVEMVNGELQERDLKF